MNEMDTALFHRAVGADHLLLDGLVTAREPIYRSPNGKTIERFRLHGQEASCIFKPLTNEELLGRERWAQRELLPRLRFRYPRLLAEAAHEDPATYWIILEDAGSLSHAGEFDVLAHAVRHVSSWQRLPAAIVPAGYAGQKPLLPEVLSVLARERSRLTRLLAEQGVSAERIAKLYRLAGQAASLPDEQVVSHGDLHIGNVALLDGEAVILDWEHVQLNSPFGTCTACWT
ncbi:phosphotransferase [Paenibacillus sp. CC-CFT747]|nr:phosphotransferase [Paenibacillus sp. CC-CFT747]